MNPILTTIALLTAPALGATAVPAEVASQLPLGYKVVVSKQVSAGQPLREFELVALVQQGEDKLGDRPENAPDRPLLIFELKNGHYLLAGRNDHVILKANEGGQCDPFLDGDTMIATKGRYFTVENGVACGEHWTNYITFRLDDRSGGFVFDNQREEAWELNPSNDPDQEALVPIEPPHVTPSAPGRPVSFQTWRPKH